MSTIISQLSCIWRVYRPKRFAKSSSEYKDMSCWKQPVPSNLMAERHDRHQLVFSLKLLYGTAVILWVAMLCQSRPAMPQNYWNNSTYLELILSFFLLVMSQDSNLQVFYLTMPILAHATGQRDVICACPNVSQQYRLVKFIGNYAWYTHTDMQASSVHTIELLRDEYRCWVMDSANIL